MASTNVGSIHYDLGLDTNKFNRASAGVTGKLKSLGGELMHVTKRIAQVGAGMAIAAATIGIKTSAQLETARQGFITLLGSAEKADKTMERIKKEAARTPFEIVGLTQATQMMASVTKDGDKAIDVVLNVGEALAAMGRGQPELDRISVNLQQIAATGKAAMIDIKQFAFAGIPIFEMLQKETGLSGEALEDFISEGKVSFDMLSKMFDTANDKGGRFFNAFKNQTGTFSQQWSNFKDTFSITMSEIVNKTGLFGALKNAMASVGTWITTNQGAIIAAFNRIGDSIKNAIAGAGNWIKNNREAIVASLHSIREALVRAWSYLKPKLDELIPRLVEFWKQVIVPMIPVIGTILVGAIGAFIDALNRILPFLTRNKEFVYVLIGALVAWKTAMAIGRVVAAFNASLALMNKALYGTTVKVGILRNALKLLPASVVIGIALAGYALVKRQIENTIGAFNRLDQSRANADAGVERYLAKLRANGATPQELSRAYVQMQGPNPLRKRAKGGPINSGEAYMVGEKGPELFVSDKVGQILSNKNTSKLAGANISTSIHGNINIGSQVDANNFMRRLTRNQELAMQGLPSMPGSV